MNEMYSTGHPESAEVENLKKQLPDGMENCTIVFEECEKGHGNLRATNWVKHKCVQCQRDALQEQVRVLEGIERLNRHQILKDGAQKSKLKKLEKPLYQESIHEERDRLKEFAESMYTIGDWWVSHDSKTIELVQGMAHDVLFPSEDSDE